LTRLSKLMQTVVFSTITCTVLENQDLRNIVPEAQM